MNGTDGTNGICFGTGFRVAPTSAVKNLLRPESPTITPSGNDGRTGPKAFGRRLRNLRLQVGLSQKQLAHSSTLSVRAIRDLENGRVRQPRADTLRLLAEALGLSVGRLANDYSLSFLAGAAEPPASGPFVGRERELAALVTMLGAEGHRLVTITGIEGVGKTRLALEVAHALEADERSTISLWLPLDDQLRGGRKPAGSSEQPTWLHEAMRSGPDSRRRLAETIGESNALLVLDDARPEHELAGIAAYLVAACPRLRILVTTRSPVEMPFDTVFPLAPLPVPSPGIEPAGLDEVPSVALLLTQMKRIRPTFRPDAQILADLARICRALDGLPAALESAAHWTLIYSLPQLIQKLTTEPLAVARRPHRGHQQPDAFASVHRTVASLSSRQRDLLSKMSLKMFCDTDGYWSVPEAVAATGMTAAECADDIYRLLILGLLRRIDQHDVAMFRVLNIASLGTWRSPGA